MNDKSKGWWAANGALLLPLLLVNAAAIYGQVGWAYEHLLIDGRRVWAVAILFALALESVGFYLAAEAHSASVANQSSARLRWGSYAVAVLVGALNYAHFASPGLKPNAVALAFGGLSVISPWLWAIRSRSLSRTQLLAAGLLDARAVKFTFAQWCLYPRRTFKAFRSAVWVGETDPARARLLVDEPVAAAEPERAAPTTLAIWTAPAHPAASRTRIGPVRRPGRLARLAGHTRTPNRLTTPVQAVPRPVPVPAPAPAVVAPAATPAPPAAKQKKPGSRKPAPVEQDRVFAYLQQNPQTGVRDLHRRFGISIATASRWRTTWKEKITA